MKKQTVGIVAHVDAGKTTCIESLLYQSGMIKKMGRVDHRDTVMDCDAEEKAHGITIYAKEGYIDTADTRFYLIDTPGHADFSSEMERSLTILDTAILVINGQDGVQAHTETIWKCLEYYHVPTIVFINKMDISYQSQEQLLMDLQKKCSSNCLSYEREDFFDELSLCDDTLLEEYSHNNSFSIQALRDAFYARMFFPVLFGSALKQQGMDVLLKLMEQLTPEREYAKELGAKVFKIGHDEQNNRLTYIKMTGGTLAVKDKINEEEKIDSIRLYQGAQYEACKEVEAGDVVALKGIFSLEVGDGLGFESQQVPPILQACMNYELVLPKQANVLAMAETMKQLASEDPQLEVSMDEKTQKIQVQLMGEMQKEILQKTILARSGMHVGFGNGAILYQETIKSAVDGAGHFEPLRHYAEVHIHLEPLPRGSGIVVDSICSTDELNATWQNSIVGSLQRKKHCGVLTGSLLTDVRITLVAGKGNIKHTSGGDFRQAALRAVRQALMKADSVVLEPFDAFTLLVSSNYLSKALFDLQNHQAQVKVSDQGNDWMKIEGRGPVRTLSNYQNEVIAYTKGTGRYTSYFDGYDISEAQEIIVSTFAYDPLSDLKNPCSSVFCANGAGYEVPWNEADELMHIQLKKESQTTYKRETIKVAEEDLHSILTNASMNNRNTNKKVPVKKEEEKPQKKVIKHLPTLLIIDGYNMIYDWPETKELAQEDLYAARHKLLSMLENIQAYTKEKMIVVFDGYLKKHNPGSQIQKGNLTIVYTRTDETADAWIERAGYQYKGIYALSVATSDALIQNAVFSQGALRISAHEMHERVIFLEQQIQEKNEG